MANSEWILKNTLENLKADVELCEKVRSPDYDLLGTLRVNLEVAERNLKNTLALLNKPAKSIACDDGGNNMSELYERAVLRAQDKDGFEQMVKFFRNSQTHSDLERAALLFVFDMSYFRADICLAVTVVEQEKGWK